MRFRKGGITEKESFAEEGKLKWSEKGMIKLAHKKESGTCLVP